MLISYGYGMSASRNILIWLGCLTVGTVGGGAIYLKSLPHPMSVAIVPKVERSTGKKTVVPQYEKLDLLKKEDLEPVETSKPIESEPTESLETEPTEDVEPEKPARKRLRFSRRNRKGADTWYKGGTLHDATMKEWYQADDQDKLATCGDIIYAIWEKDGFKPEIQDSILSTDHVKVLAAQLVRALDTIGPNENDPEDVKEWYGDGKVKDMAVTLIITMKWNK
jgi:hypothetical protein